MTKRFFTIFIILALASAITLSASATTCTNNCERRWYTENNELITDVETIDKLENSVTQTLRSTFCCDNMKKVTYYDEQHVYDPPTPAPCTYDRYKLVICKACSAVFSYDYVGQYFHVHQ